MTIIGIAGCTSLMVAAFGLRESITDIAKTQFDVLEQYDLKIELNSPLQGSSAAGEAPRKEPDKVGGLSFENLLSKYGLREGAGEKSYLPIQSEAGYLMLNTARLGVSVYTPKTAENFGDYIILRDRKTKKLKDFADNGVYITEKMAEALNLKSGSVFSVENGEGKTGDFTLTGTFENYVGNYVFIGADAYTGVFGPGLSYRTLLVKSGIRGAADQDRLVSEVLGHDQAAEAEFGSRIQQSYNKLLSSISFVVLILIAAAGALAMIVLYNLTNININERSRELATLRVLGFHQNEAAAYIFRETGVLSILGAGAGLFLGIPLHRFIIAVAENTDLMFGRSISAPSFILSAFITVLFSFFTDLLMLKKIRGIKMADSMKAAE
jgi:putative ABC transport system permease protein